MHENAALLNEHCTMCIYYIVFLCLAQSVFVDCGIDRRDIHRIVLKSERSKQKHHHPKQASGHHYHRDVDYEPRPHSSTYHSSEETFYKPYEHTYNRDEYNELVKPKPPKTNELPFIYPEEQPVFEYQPASSNQYNVPIKINTDSWSPIPINHEKVINKPTAITFSNIPNPIRKKKRKPVIKTEPTITLSQLVEFTTSKPIKYTNTQHNIFNSFPKSTQHFFNFNNNNKSLVQYEVSGKYQDSDSIHKTPSKHLYEVYENGADFRPLTKPNIYPNYNPSVSSSQFLPTVNTNIDLNFFDTTKNQTAVYGRRFKPRQNNNSYKTIN